MRRFAEDVPDKTSAAEVCAGRSDADNVIGVGDVHAGLNPQCDVVATGGIAKQRAIAMAMLLLPVLLS